MRKIMIIILGLAFLFGIVKTETVFFDMPLLGKKVYLDAGHGGIDSGATYKDILEKDINLEIVLKLEEELSKKGALVYLTREKDEDLASENARYRKRSDLANRALLIEKSDADIFISIHLNSYYSSKWSGAQVFYTLKNEKNEALATLLQKKLNENRNYSIIENMYMYDRITKTGILIEVGFLSNASDREKLLDDNYQKELVSKIVAGIINYYVVN